MVASSASSNHRRPVWQEYFPGGTFDWPQNGDNETGNVNDRRLYRVFPVRLDRCMHPRSIQTGMHQIGEGSGMSEKKSFRSRKHFVGVRDQRIAFKFCKIEPFLRLKIVAPFPSPKR
jgi:hypothetical protein